MNESRDELKLNPLNRPVVGKEVRELAAEIRADEQAARVRDGLTKPETVVSAYEQALEEAAGRGGNRDKDRGGMER